jgi:hypothetical protein
VRRMLVVIIWAPVIFTTLSNTEHGWISTGTNKINHELSSLPVRFSMYNRIVACTTALRQIELNLFCFLLSLRVPDTSDDERMNEKHRTCMWGKSYISIDSFQRLFTRTK